MTPGIILKFLKDFVSLNPTSGQIFNLFKYSTHFFLNRFNARVTYDPLSIGIYITYSCNLKCSYCWNPTINNKEFLNETITVKEFSEVLEHPRLKNAFRVSFVGGEPLIHPDLFEFIEICREKKKLTMFPSNGLLIQKRIEEFKNSSLTSLQVSLYDGYIEKQLENIKELRKVNPHIKISLARYVTREKESYAYMEKVIEMADGIGLYNICFQNFEPRDSKDAYLSIYNDDIEVLEHFQKIRSKYGKKFNITFPSPLIRDFSKRFCYDLHTVIFVGKGGKISPCSTIVPPDDKYGNISDKDFWNNDYFVSHRRNYNKMFPFNPVCEYCYESSRHERTFV